MVENKKKTMSSNEVEGYKERPFDLSKKDLKELLIKSHMTHDAMWFYHCQKECGMKMANKLNRAAIMSFAPIEIKRIQAKFGLKIDNDMESLKALMDAAFKVFKADFMHVEYSFPNDACLKGEVLKCWAYDGMLRNDFIDEYECGVFDRIEGWLKTMGFRFEVEPSIKGCMMHEQGRCFRNFTFRFKDE